MSDFECAKGHLMRSGEMHCKICGSRLARMDGMSGRQLAEIDREWDRQLEEEMGDEEEPDHGRRG